MNLAPIVLFVYNRPWHTEQTVEALKKNSLANESELIIYCDAAKNDTVSEAVDHVRSYVKQIQGFKKIKIIEREENWGLADSIIDGVSHIINEYGKIIVLEDDLVTSPYFLKFMNEALEFYKNEKKVWHISGWNYPIDSTNLGDVFLWRTMNCWGWATWKDRWSHYEKDVEQTINAFSKEDIKRFNLNGTENFWSQVLANKKGKINTWAIFWYASIFKNDGLCLNPIQTYVENIGHDSSGTHCKSKKSYSDEISMNKEFNFDIKIMENSSAIYKIQKFNKNQNKITITKIVNKISRIIIGRNLIS